MWKIPLLASKAASASRLELALNQEEVVEMCY